MNGQNTLKWGFKDIILVYLGIIFFTLLFGYFSQTIFSFFVEYINIPNIDVSFFILAFIVQFTVTVLLVLAIAVWKNKATLEELGVKNVSLDTYIKYGFLGGILLLIAITMMGIPLQYFYPEVEPQLFEEMLRSVTSLPTFIILLIMGAVLAPLSEELFFRGMVYPVFRKYTGPLWGAILAGLVFGFAHWDPYRAIPLAVGGAVLCYIYEKTGSIIVCTIAHGIWNGIISIVVYLSILNMV